MNEPSLFLWIIAALFTFTGLAGLVLPLVPGVPLLFFGLFCGAWAEGFAYVGFWTLLALAVMAGLTYLVEFVASALGAKAFGGSRRAMLGAFIGGLLGLALGVPGILVGPFVGAVIGELTLQRTLEQASRSGFGTVVGMALGVAGKLSLGLAMLGLFFAVRLF